MVEEQNLFIFRYLLNTLGFFFFDPSALQAKQGFFFLLFFRFLITAPTVAVSACCFPSQEELKDMQKNKFTQPALVYIFLRILALMDDS